MDIFADWKEICDEGLTEFRIDLPSVLIDLAFGNVDVLELWRGYCSVAGTSQKRKGDQCPIAPLDLRFHRHRGEDMTNLL
jgi:hypothetical protein